MTSKRKSKKSNNQDTLVVNPAPAKEEQKEEAAQMQTSTLTTATKAEIITEGGEEATATATATATTVKATIMSEITTPTAVSEGERALNQDQEQEDNGTPRATIKKEKTEVLLGLEGNVSTLLKFINNTKAKYDTFFDRNGPSINVEADQIRYAIENAVNKRGIKVRAVTEITKDNFQDCKEYMKMITELRHLEGIKSGSGVFAVNEGEYISTSIQQEPEQEQEQQQQYKEEKQLTKNPSPQIIYSNVRAIVRQHQYLFDTLWDKATPAQQKIREIEEGVEPEFYEVITDYKKASQVLLDLVQSVKKQALIFLPNDKALVSLSSLGIIGRLIKASNNGATIRIISLLTDRNSEIVRKILEKRSEIRILDGSSPSSFYLFIVDRARFLLTEISESFSISTSSPTDRDDSETLKELIGDFSLYSNSRLSVESFSSIFELLWKERLLNEELKKTDRMQKDFINMTAHEFRTPLQPILGISEMCSNRANKDKKEVWEAQNGKYGGDDDKQENNMEIIYRNAKKMRRLIEDILDVSKIESQLFSLNKEVINLNEIISKVVDNYTYKNYYNKNNRTLITHKNNNQTTSVRTVSFDPQEDYHLRRDDGSNNSNSGNRPEEDKNAVIFVNADGNRLYQVLDNIINNAFKITKEGCINISIKTDDKEAIVSITNTGVGIDPKIIPTIFEKFATVNTTDVIGSGRNGLGLGLFIAKSIIDAHEGRIWAENNKDGNAGATVSFSLPTVLKRRS